MKIISRYTDDADKRELLCQFTDVIFPGADFRRAYKLGGWGPTYFPMSIVEDGRIVSNIAWSEMSLLLNGVSVPAIQLATVGTLPEFRNRGYSRLLLERLIAEYETKTGVMFLYGNDTVLDFYPLFGFEPVQESLFQLPLNSIKPKASFRVLDMEQSDDFQLLQKLAFERLPVTELFGAHNYAHALLWQVANGLDKCLRFLEDEHIIVVCEQIDSSLHVYDVLALEPCSFEEILPRLISDSNMTHVVFHFTPELLNLQSAVKAIPSEEALFIRGEFPIPAQTFKYPATGQT